MEQTEPQITVYPRDPTACGLYRMTWPGEAVKRSGKPVQVAKRAPGILVDEATNKVRGVNIGNADVVVFQRASKSQDPEIIEVLQYNNKRVVVDMDDSFSKIHPQNPAYQKLNPKTNPQKNWLHVAKSCEMADLVTVTTEALAEEYGQHGRVSVIPNHVPESYLKVQRPLNEVPVVGWAGWTQTHPDDLRVTKGMIGRVLEDTGAKFAAYGDKKIYFDLGMRQTDKDEYWGFTNVLDYPKTLVGFDIGIVPLLKSPFNEAKSWLKGLEYAALGIVPVVTPIGDYNNLIEMGAAIPANTPEEWYERVRELILDNEMRQELSDKVRNIASNWTIEGNSHKWWNAWSNIV